MHIDKYFVMNKLKEIYQKVNVNESKYGWRFDQYKQPFRLENKKILDNNGKELATVPSVELGKELIQILNDLHKIRDAAEKIATLWK